MKKEEIRVLMEYLDGRFGLIERRMDELDSRMLNLESSMDYLVGTVDDMSVELRAVAITQSDDHERRIRKLELAGR